MQNHAMFSSKAQDPGSDRKIPAMAMAPANAMVFLSHKSSILSARGYLHVPEYAFHEAFLLDPGSQSEGTLESFIFGDTST